MSSNVYNTYAPLSLISLRYLIFANLDAVTIYSFQLNKHGIKNQTCAGLKVSFINYSTFSLYKKSDEK